MTEAFEIVGEGHFAVPVEYVVAVQEFAAEHGVAPQEILRDTGIPIRTLIQSRARVGHLAMTQLVKNLQRAVPDPLLPILYGQRLTLASHGMLGFAAKSCATLREVSEIMGRFFETRAGGVELRILNTGKYASLRLLPAEETFNPETGPFFALSTLITIESIARRLVGRVDQWVDTEILLSFPSPCEIPESMLSPGLKLKFDQAVNELRSPLELLDLPIASADAALAGAAKEQCEAELARLNTHTDAATFVRMALRDAQGPFPTVDEIAPGLAMSPRTLKRRLSEAGTSYQKIKDSERFRRAIYLMETTDDTVEQVATALGYSDASNFTKAFKAWAGTSPGAYRDKLRD